MSKPKYDAEFTRNRWLDLAKAELGDREGRDDAKILTFFQDAGHSEVHTSATAWCAAFCGAMLHRAGMKRTDSLMARSYLNTAIATKLSAPKIGCIAILWRNDPNGSEGHVGFVTGFTDDHITLLAGNQGNAGVVSEETFPKTRVLGYAWPQPK
jgi:uncharacterized protein (TIGR02594 family)